MDQDKDTKYFSGYAQSQSLRGWVDPAILLDLFEVRHSS
jgi:hypothetical protein